VVHNANSQIEELRSELLGMNSQFPLLQQKSLYFDLLFENIPDSLFFKDIDSRFTMVNRAWMQQHQVSDINSVIGKTDHDFFQKSLAEIFSLDDQRIITSGKPQINKIDKIKNEQGPPHWIITSKFPIIDSHKGVITGIFGISRTISSLTDVETALAQERDMLHLLLDNSHDAIYFKDIKSRYLRISRGHPAMQFIKSPEEAVGKTDFDYFPIEHAQAAFDDEIQIISTGKPILGKFEKETSTGISEKWVFTSKLPMYDDLGTIIGTFGISRDISKIKMYENELQKAKDDLEERVRLRTEDLQKANANLKLRISQLDFLTTASYEMAQCDGIPALVSVILRSFSSILGESAGSLCITDDKEFKCVGTTGILDTENHQYISEQTIKQFSSYKLTRPRIIKNWVEQLPDAQPWAQLHHLPYYIAIPLLTDNRLIGILLLFAGHGDHLRFREERKVILTLVSHAAVSLSNAIFYKELSEKAQLKGELEAARSIQQRLTPNHKPSIPRINLKGLYSPAYEVGGDYLDYFKNDAGCWVVVIADVCGKGVPAAMMMTLLRSSFRNDARNEISAKNLLCSVNDSMRVNLDERLFATAICLIINPDGTSMSYARAGHPRLIHINGETGEARTYHSSGIALGILSDMKSFSDTIEEISIPLNEGDRFFIYTDGLTEAFNPQKIPYGIERLMKVLRGDNGTVPETMVQTIIQDIKLFTQGAPYHDDLTFISMYVNAIDGHS
jgi:PAS domain S-box-containing protein